MKILNLFFFLTLIIFLVDAEIIGFKRKRVHPSSNSVANENVDNTIGETVARGQHAPPTSPEHDLQEDTIQPHGNSSIDHHNLMMHDISSKLSRMLPSTSHNEPETSPPRDSTASLLDQGLLKSADYIEKTVSSQETLNDMNSLPAALERLNIDNIEEARQNMFGHHATEERPSKKHRLCKSLSKLLSFKGCINPSNDNISN
ncbi:hypothetical protein ACQ4LE_003282 [Meloidogyne hapla]